MADSVSYRRGPYSAFQVDGRNLNWKFDWEAFNKAQEELERLEKEYPPMVRALLTEAGLLIEFHGKRLIRVDTGRLRSSWGHYTPGTMTAKAKPGDRALARASAVFIPPSKLKRGAFEVTVGTRVRYAPHVNYRLGDLYVERALSLTVSALPALVTVYLKKLESGDV